jgi:hypothetical protein
VDEPARLAQRHRRYYWDKVVAAQLNWFGPAEQDLLDWARAAWDNIVTAIETSLTSGEPALGLEISTGLITLPIFKGSPREMRRWTERTLQATHMDPADDRTPTCREDLDRMALFPAGQERRCRADARGMRRRLRR